ncbi:hypothetical protein QBC35DRAFT_482229 [Podospora australis]|uniref:CN hydrolase domain-containing protein n=1 Tax=Podospora australis TaxID=1536484 RepID=A0AAN7APJ8_9PEZI|nr:hypothetical protein QBC35DRAFT_482229 [Podospora australis]
MKIACLQFAPQVGDVDNNLNRADAVLNKSKLAELDGLDLLVLPELAFTGYNFKSLQHISPFLEHPGSGITSLWARTTALKHDCAVVVGYPEKVDVSNKWPASPEYYNSALLVNRDGDTVGNYRKAFLFYTDETWALEGGDGFFRGSVEGLGDVALGICTDINPYQLEAPWDAFEFGYHVLDSQANVVIVTMAWQTQDPVQCSRRPKEPDLEALVYWVQRLEPLIRAEKEEEVIVVFCNRTGAENEVMYTGTSAVLGIKGGEVFVYGIVGRGVKEVLFVDTDLPPISKLTAASAVEVENPYAEETDTEGDPASKQEPSPVPTPTTARLPSKVSTKEPPAIAPIDTRVESAVNTPLSPRLPWLAPSDDAAPSPSNPRSPTRLQIPTVSPTRTVIGEFTLIDSALAEDVIVESPSSSDNVSPPYTAPAQSRLAQPTTPWRFKEKQSPYPWHRPDGSQSSMFGGGACMTPITPINVEDVWNATPIDPKPPGKWFFKHEQNLSALKESIQEEEDEPVERSQVQRSVKPTVAEPAHTDLPRRVTKIKEDYDRDATPIDTEPPEWYWKHEPTLSSLNEAVLEEEEEEDEPYQAAGPEWLSTPIEEEPPGWHWKHEPTLATLDETTAQEEEDENDWIGTPIEEDPPDWYWKHEPTLATLGESNLEEEEEIEEESEYQIASRASESAWVATPIDEDPPEWYWKHEPELSALDEETLEEEEEQEEREEDDEQPTAPATEDWADLSTVLSGLKIHPGSALNNNIRGIAQSDSQRPGSPKSRNASRNNTTRSSQYQFQSFESVTANEPARDVRSPSPKIVPSRPASRAGQYTRPPSRLRHAMSASADFDVPEEESDDEEPFRGRRGRPVQRPSVDYGRNVSSGRSGIRAGSIERPPSTTGRKFLLSGGGGKPQQHYNNPNRPFTNTTAPFLTLPPLNTTTTPQRQHPQKIQLSMDTTRTTLAAAHNAGLVASPVPFSGISVATVDDLPNPETPQFVTAPSHSSSSLLARGYSLPLGGEPAILSKDGGGDGSSEFSWAASSASLLNDEWAKRREEGDYLRGLRRGYTS